MRSKCRMQRRKPLEEKSSWNPRNPALPSRKKNSQYFMDSHQRRPRLFSKAQNGAESTVLGFEKKPKSKEINLKYHIRFRKPVYHRKTRIRQKNREIQGTQPCPAEKKFPVFLNSYQRKPRLFSKPQNGAKITVLHFFAKKKTKKTDPNKKKTGLEPPLLKYTWTKKF